MSRPLFTALALTAALLAASAHAHAVGRGGHRAAHRAPAAAPPPSAAPQTVELVGPRIRLGDLLPGAPAEAREVDLGPVPGPAGSRLVERAEMARALSDAKVRAPARLPGAVRVVRKMRHLTAAQTEQITRAALGASGLGRGATLAAVRAPRALEVPDGWTAVKAETPRPPRRAGSFPTVATVTLSNGAEILATLSVPVELTLAADASAPDVARGAALKLVIRRGLVEVTAAATAGTDGDVGEIVPAVVRSTGRALRARILDRETALAVESP